MANKKKFLGFRELDSNKNTVFKFLLNNGVRIREVVYEETAIWERYYLAEFKGVGLKFMFSEEGSKKDGDRIIEALWKLFDREISKREKE